MPPATDEQLVHALKSGDMESLGVLVTRWEQPLYRFVCRLLPRSEDARDVCQETFLRILRKCHRFKSDARFSTWMYQIALNLCRDQQRRRQRWSFLLAPDRDASETATERARATRLDDDPGASLERREAGEALAAALSMIPAEQREVLILKEYEGMKFREIAEILGCPESTVKSRMYYGLSGVRAALERSGYDRP